MRCCSALTTTSWPCARFDAFAAASPCMLSTCRRKSGTLPVKGELALPRPVCAEKAKAALVSWS